MYIFKVYNRLSESCAKSVEKRYKSDVYFERKHILDN